MHALQISDSKQARFPVVLFHFVQCSQGLHCQQRNVDLQTKSEFPHTYRVPSLSVTKNPRLSRRKNFPGPVCSSQMYLSKQ